MIPLPTRARRRSRRVRRSTSRAKMSRTRAREARGRARGEREHGAAKTMRGKSARAENGVRASRAVVLARARAGVGRGKISFTRAMRRERVRRLARVAVRDVFFRAPARRNSSTARGDAARALVREAGRELAEREASSSRARSAVTFELEVLPALRRFYADHGHVNVPRGYVVPSDAPPEIAGARLGNRVERIRHRGDFVRGDEARMRALDEVGAATGETFSWDHEDFVFYKQIVPCLRYHIKEHMSSNVALDYCTPSEAEAYSSSNSLKRYNMGFPLGKRVNDIRAKGTFIEGRPDRFDALSKMEFVWDDAMYQWYNKFIRALEIYKRVHGHMLVPRSYVVSETMVDPLTQTIVYIGKDLIGYELGSAVAQIRSTRLQNRVGGDGLEKSRVRQLNQIGFAWNVAEWEFNEQLLPAVQLTVEARNSVPSDPKFRFNTETISREGWPKALLDYPMNEKLELLCKGKSAWPVDKIIGTRRLLDAFRHGRAAYARRKDGGQHAFQDHFNFFARLCGVHKKEYEARRAGSAVEPSPASDDTSDKTT